MHGDKKKEQNAVQVASLFVNVARKFYMLDHSDAIGLGVMYPFLMSTVGLKTSEWMNKVHTYKTPSHSRWLIVVLEDQRMDLGVTKTSIAMPIIVNNIYNLIVCKDSGIGLPFEWVLSHLQEHHGIRVTSEHVLTFLDLEEDAMTVTEAKDWISSMWVGRVVQSIPIVKGYGCNECQYSAATKRVMKNHFSKEHKGSKVVDHSIRVQSTIGIQGWPSEVHSN